MKINGYLLFLMVLPWLLSAYLINMIMDLQDKISMILRVCNGF